MRHLLVLCLCGLVLGACSVLPRATHGQMQMWEGLHFPIPEGYRWETLPTDTLTLADTPVISAGRLLPLSANETDQRDPTEDMIFRRVRFNGTPQQFFEAMIPNLIAQYPNAYPSVGTITFHDQPGLSYNLDLPDGSRHTGLVAKFEHDLIVIEVRNGHLPVYQPVLQALEGAP